MSSPRNVEKEEEEAFRSNYVEKEKKY